MEGEAGEQGCDVAGHASAGRNQGYEAGAQ